MRDVARPAYLPIDRRHAILAGASLAAHARGAALFADIAGFTRLSRELSESHGARGGVDLLSEVLEAVYAVVVAEIHDHGGTVIGFSGDAVTCWFDDEPRGVIAPPDGTPLPSGAARALTSALSLTRSMALLPPVEIAPGGGDGPHAVSMAVKVAVASGEVCRSLAGDPAYQVVEVIGGATVARLADLEKVAELGEVLVDPPTLTALGSGAAGIEIAEERPTPSGPALVVTAAPPTPSCPWSPITDGALTEDDVLAWVGWQIRDRADTALTELRPTVALFLRFTPFELDTDPDAAADLDRFVRWVQSVIAPTDGNLIQVTVGDKSSYLYISYGAPRSHEDLAARAATAALRLVQPPDDLAMVRPLQAGIAHGMSRVGAYGSRESMTYGALGDGTNLAARLMSVAPADAVLVARRAAQACGPSFRFSEHPPVQAKGFTDPVDVALLTGRTAYLAPDAAHRRTLVGRDAEVAHLVTRLRSITEHGGGAVYVRGEAGSGKSHLVAEAKRRILAEAEVTWLAAEADELTGTALHPFLGILRDLTFQELATSDEDRRALFDATIDALVEDLSGRGPAERDLADELDRDRSFLAALIDLADHDSPYAHHDPRNRFARCLQAYELLIRAEAARRPVILHLSDGQWLDDQSRQLLAILRRCAAENRLGLLVDERAEARADAREPAAEDEVIDLRALDLEGVTTMMATLLGGPVSPELARAVHGRSQGGPLFVEQLVVDLSERGRLREDPGVGWQLVGTTDEELPVNLTTVLVSRLDRLPGPVAEVVQMASVVGVELDRSVLAAVVDRPEHLDEAVAEAETAGILLIDADRPDAVRFHHALVRDAAYGMQPAARRREAHARVAAALLDADEDARDALAPSIAWHFERADDPANALGELRRAAAAAERLPDPPEARSFLERALRCARATATTPAVLTELLRDLARNASASGDYQTAVAELEAALSTTDDAATRTALLHLLGEAQARCGRLADAETAFEAGVETLQEAPDAALAGRLYAGLAMLHAERGELDDAADLAELSLLFAQADDDPAALAWAHHRMGIIALLRGARADARANANEALVAFTGLDRLDGQAGTHNTLGLLALDEGRPADGIAELERAVELFERSGNEHGLACALDNLADALRRNDREQDAYPHLERAVAILARIGLDDQAVLPAMWRAGTW